MFKTVATSEGFSIWVIIPKLFNPDFLYIESTSYVCCSFDLTSWQCCRDTALVRLSCYFFKMDDILERGYNSSAILLILAVNNEAAPLLLETSFLRSLGYKDKLYNSVLFKCPKKSSWWSFNKCQINRSYFLLVSAASWTYCYTFFFTFFSAVPVTGGYPSNYGP